MSNVIFRDRGLKNGEKSHYHCTECGQDVHQDFVDTHKCSIFTETIKEVSR